MGGVLSSIGDFANTFGGLINPAMWLGAKSLGIGGGGYSNMQPPPGMSASDFMNIAHQQYDLNRYANIEGLYQNRPAQYTPYGSSTWSSPNGVDWQQNVSLSPELQQAFDQQNALRLQRGDLAGGLTGTAAWQLGQPLGVLPPLLGLPSAPSLQNGVNLIGGLPFRGINLQPGVNLQGGVNLDPQQQAYQAWPGMTLNLDQLLGPGPVDPAAQAAYDQAQGKYQTDLAAYQQQQAQYQQALAAWNATPAQTTTAPTPPPHYAGADANAAWAQPYGPNGPYTTNRNTVYVPGYGEFGPKVPDWLYWDPKLGGLVNKNATKTLQGQPELWHAPAGWTGSPGNYSFTPISPSTTSTRGPAPTAPTGTAPTAPTAPTPTPRGTINIPPMYVQPQAPPDWTNPTALRLRAEDALYNQSTSRLDPMWNTRQQQLMTQLYNQGLRPGDEAYEREMASFERARTDAYQQANYGAITGGGTEAQRQFGMDLAARQQRVQELFGQGQFANDAALQAAEFANQAALSGGQFANQWALQGGQFANQAALESGQFLNQALLQGFDVNQALSELAMRQREQLRQEELQKRLQPINEMNALMTGQQVQMPGMPAFQPGGPQPSNLLGAYTSGIQAQLGAYGIQQAQQNALLGGLGSLLPMLLAGGGGGGMAAALPALTVV